MLYHNLVKEAVSSAHDAGALPHTNSLCLPLSPCPCLNPHRLVSPSCSLSSSRSKKLKAIQQQLCLLLGSGEGKLAANKADKTRKLSFSGLHHLSALRLEVGNLKPGHCHSLDQLVDFLTGFRPSPKAPAFHPAVGEEAPLYPPYGARWLGSSRVARGRVRITPVLTVNVLSFVGIQSCQAICSPVHCSAPISPSWVSGVPRPRCGNRLQLAQRVFSSPLPPRITVVLRGHGGAHSGSVWRNLPQWLPIPIPACMARLQRT